ncbi:hypothetical protein PSECIP111951_01699 [Pseudoalteromonas holothuriae]|uniref:Solute-binding protein family 3/N-terminal domain-containing protein n=1 Tax=Pseudoalteromonas holothuriae TaxID=2963714 RepID=A0ABN8UKB9_9GAMM|nr:hypothetical protein [Pseudoalteromonas sp. CIP111951]CAH9057589.1 hypothetical protein PSECIP111951_01699 [Pseudoalteromonas sp. CIP111951]
MHLILILLFTLYSTAVNATEVSITIEKDIYHYAQIILGDQSVHDIKDFNHPLCQRDVVEFVLIQKALKLGGIDLKFNFHLGNYDARNIKLLINGLLLVGFDTIWLQTAKKYSSKLYISDPIIRKGEYVAGVYTKKNNLKAMKDKIDSGLSKVTFVSSSAWHADWHTLKALKPKSLVDESDWIVMAKMVSRGWVDAMLVPFNNQIPFQYSGNGYSIEAINGIKVPLQDSRHFAVSRSHPLAEQTFLALQSGIKKLRAQGFIEQAYRQCGFFNDTVNDWRAILPQNTPE